MEKYRVIIADPDDHFFNHLQQKFLEELFGEVGLEVISDPGYYKQFFINPQRADVLIVSEQWYDRSALRHNIKYIFIMTEQQMPGRATDPNTYRIYKYNIEKAFDSIVEISGLQRPGPKKGPQILLFYSACGGVGKTTLALGVCACLNRDYKRVLYINASRLQTFQVMLSDRVSITSPGIYAKILSSPDNIYAAIKPAIRSEGSAGFNYVPPFKAALMALNIPYNIFEKIALSAKESGDYDYIVIDADSVFDEEKVRLIDIADQVVMVTKQSKRSTDATNILLENMDAASSSKFLYICNDFESESGNTAQKEIDGRPVDGWVRHLSYFDYLKTGDLSKEEDMQKVAVLVT